MWVSRRFTDGSNGVIMDKPQSGFSQTGLFGYYDCVVCNGKIGIVQCPSCLKRWNLNPLTTYSIAPDPWIKCSDRMPKEGQRVIYYFHYVGVHAGNYTRTVDEDGVVSHVFYGPSGFLSDDVTHWMPFPEPPAK
jgi:hypothetical protein